MNDLIPKIAGIIREGNPLEGEAIHENILAREIVRVMSEDIKECLLTDEELEEADTLLGQDYYDELNANKACLMEGRNKAQAQLQKILILLASKEEHGS